MKKKRPSFCTYCGAKLEVPKAVVQNGYDAYTGMANVVLRIYFRCPNEQKLFNDMDRHDLLHIDEPAENYRHDH